MKLVMTIPDVAAFIDAAFPPETRRLLGEAEHLEPGRFRMRLDPIAAMLRPGTSSRARR